MFDRFEVVEIEATDGTALGIEVDVTDHEALTAMVARVVSRRGVGPMFWPRMQAAVVVGPWMPRPAPSIGPPTAFTLIGAPHTTNWRYELSPVLSSRVRVPIDQLVAAVAETVIFRKTNHSFLQTYYHCV